MKPIGIGVIGAGGIAGRWHLPEIAAIDDFELRVVSGRKQSRLDYLAGQFGGRTTASYREVIDATDVDAVVVATPHPLHVDWGIAVIEAGKHLMMQKPLSGDLDEANRFADAADDAKSTVFCLPHFGTEVCRAKELIDSGQLGTVSGAYARTSHGGPELYYADIRKMFGEEADDELWFFDAKQASVGALFDMGVYAVSRLVALLGNVKCVYGRVTTLEKPTALEDGASIMLEFDRGCVATAETSWCDPAWTWSFTVHGTEAKVFSQDLLNSTLTRYTPTSKTKEDAPVEVEEIDLAQDPVGNAHEVWRDSILSGSQPTLSNWQAARHVTEILLAALESSRKRAPVEVRSRL